MRLKLPDNQATRHLLLAFGLLYAMAANAAGQTYFIIGDTGDCILEGSALVGKALRNQPDWQEATLIETGDLSYQVATRERLLACHEPHFSGFSRRLAVPGNHDWADQGGAGFFATFPGDIPRQETLNGRWKLLMLNSNLREQAQEQQLDWLDKTLAANRDQCLIAAWHHPRWSSGKHGDNRFVQPLWERLQGRVTFSLHGHDHHFEVLPAIDRSGQPTPVGVPSFIVGNSGAVLYSAGLGPNRSRHAHYGQWGFMRLELDGSHYSWQAINTDGKVIDHGEGECSPAGQSHAPR
jgi:hypothetical protein